MFNIHLFYRQLSESPKAYVNVLLFANCVTRRTSDDDDNVGDDNIEKICYKSLPKPLEYNEKVYFCMYIVHSWYDVSMSWATYQLRAFNVFIWKWKWTKWIWNMFCLMFNIDIFVRKKKPHSPYSNKKIIRSSNKPNWTEFESILSERFFVFNGNLFYIIIIIIIIVESMLNAHSCSMYIEFICCMPKIENIDFHLKLTTNVNE